MSLTLTVLGGLFAVLAAAGVIYSLMTATFMRRFFHAPTAPALAATTETVTLLKPLHGAEPGLAEALATAFRQRLDQPLDIVLGVQDPADSALPVVEALIAGHPQARARLSIGDAKAANRKIGNLMQMSAEGLGDIVVVSDSDIGLAEDHLARVLGALAEPEVGVVTCPYYGRGVAGPWSELAAMGVSYQFLPNLVTGVSLGMAHPCMGSTIALRHETLDRIGGFAAFRDVLADDYAIGAAVRALGLRSVVAPLLVSHTAGETSLSQLYSHEVRWARTVKGVDPGGYAGSIVTYPVPLALIAVVLLKASPVSLILLAVALLARHAVKVSIDEATHHSSGPWWALPWRDMLSLIVFAGSFLGRTVTWRGEMFRVASGGRLTRP